MYSTPTHPLRGHSILWSQDFNPEVLDVLFKFADHYKRNPIDVSLERKIVAMLFYEASTRTRLSFTTAVQGLGGACISTENAKEFSSAAKGESFSDTIRVISSYCDAIVLRHKDGNAAQDAHERLRRDNIWTPIINAGCGGFDGQHPTQSLLDLYTIRMENGRLDNLRVVMLGDHVNSRTVRSLAYLLGRYPKNHIDFVSPSELSIGIDILDYLERHHTSFSRGKTIDDVIAQADVVYVTRLQKERMDEATHERVKGSYRLTVELAERMKSEGRIMHPLPRVDEIEEDVDLLPQAAYFRQSDNGVPVRKALLRMILRNW